MRCIFEESLLSFRRFFDSIDVFFRIIIIGVIDAKSVIAVPNKSLSLLRLEVSVVLHRSKV